MLHVDDDMGQLGSEVAQVDELVVGTHAEVCYKRFAVEGGTGGGEDYDGDVYGLAVIPSETLDEVAQLPDASV